MNDYPDQHAVMRQAIKYLPVKKRKRRRVKSFRSTFTKIPAFRDMIETERMIPIPKLFYDLCHFILEHADRDGIFIQIGSKIKQLEVKKKIHRKETWQNEDVDVIDAAALLKYYIKMIPGYLIPPIYDELLLDCYNMDNRVEVLLLATLLLPLDNLNLLSFLMNFFGEVAKFSRYNKMTSYDLAVCMTPNITHVDAFSGEVVAKLTDITYIFIMNSERIGIVPPYIHNQIQSDEQNRNVGNVGKMTDFFINIRRKIISFFC